MTLGHIRQSWLVRNNPRTNNSSKYFRSFQGTVLSPSRFSAVRWMAAVIGEVNLAFILARFFYQLFLGSLFEQCSSSMQTNLELGSPHGWYKLCFSTASLTTWHSQKATSNNTNLSNREGWIRTTFQSVKRMNVQCACDGPFSGTPLLWGVQWPPWNLFHQLWRLSALEV